MFLIFRWIFFILFYVFDECSSQLIRPSNLDETVLIPRVVNGKPASLGEVPYQIGFKTPIPRFRRLYSTFCGGTIIAPTKLLSAAHCFEQRKSSCTIYQGSIILHSKQLLKKYAVAGTLWNEAKIQKTDDMNGGGQWRELKNVIFPSGYKFPKHDIAVVMIFIPFHFNDHVAAIPYTTINRDYRGKCLVSGYGRTSTTKQIRSEKLLVAHLELIPSYLCSRLHRKNMRQFICTSSKLTDVGKGDSGGPLVCSNTGDPKESKKGILVGIVSGNRYRVGSFFTRVSSYHKYIEQSNADTITLCTY
ncbi:plasma kallikrein-like [Galleria mellonella]|uniref:Plasma kallikrein-like n=1 Tax=Galleria mellonella TaxID=7137 RepID=A0ABM3MVI8_GALME|nr:plasma kallikrein-like [Galleria mellonella]